MNKINYENIDWQESGLLYGQEGIRKEKILHYLNQINFNNEDLNEETKSFLAPVVMRIVSNICDILDPIENNKLSNTEKYYLQHINLSVFDKINVKDIEKQLNEFVTVYLPISKQYLSNVDYEGELIYLFPFQYIKSLI